MGKYNELFIRHIMVEFKFNIIAFLKQHFKAHGSLVLSFKPNEIVIQTNGSKDVDIRGHYTTRIPLESLKEYDYDCNFTEVNVIMHKSMMGSGICKNISVVPNGKVFVSDCIVPLVKVSLGDHSFTSKIDYQIHRLGEPKYKRIVVRSPELFKGQLGTEFRLFVVEDGTILFCGCHHCSEGDTIIQYKPGECRSYDMDDDDCVVFDYELPVKIFKQLFSFIGKVVSTNKDIAINNFEILIRRCEVPPEEPPEMVKIGPITIAKPAPSTLLRRRIEDEGSRKGREMLRQNFDSRDYWDNIKPHCHALAEHIEGTMVLPEFKINYKYYSTHVLFKDFEPIRRSEYIRNDEDELNKPCITRRAFEEVANMIEECSLNGVKVT